MRRPSGSAAKPPVRLRTFHPGDFETLWEIDQLCYEPRVAYSRRALREFLGARGARCIVAETIPGGEAKLVGFCITHRQAERAYIVTIDVLARYRNVGVGAALLREAEGRLTAEGVGELSLDTAVDNLPAIFFWEKHGYRRIGVRKGYYPNGVDAFAMRKCLTRSTSQPVAADRTPSPEET